MNAYNHNFTFSRLFLIVAIILSFASHLPLRAQSIDNRGREFWVTFMPNLGSDGVGAIPNLRLYIASHTPVEVSITHMATGMQKSIPIEVLDRIVEVDINTLFGNNCELADVDSNAGSVSKKSFHISAASEITLLGASLQSKSSDAFLGLPEESLGLRYFVLCYTNGFSGNSSFGEYDTPSQFAVVATEDDTQVEIKPGPIAIFNGGIKTPFTVLLSRGEVFLAQGDLTGGIDLTGTEIIANKRVAVFGGNKRTSIPTKVGNYRDHLVEQLPPVNLWGKEVVLAPYADADSLSTADTAIVRVLAANTGTMVTVRKESGDRTYWIGPGMNFELSFTEPMSIIATEPILVAQYEHSANRDNAASQFGNMGDPFMMLATPSEQFQREYTIESLGAQEFRYHYINIVASGDAIGSLRIDGQPTGAEFKPIPVSNHRYAQIPVSPGSHHVIADSPFGLYAYGYGQSTSYGYPGGFNFSGIAAGVQMSPVPAPVLLSSFPNPVSGSAAKLDLLLPERENVSITLIDVEGKIVRSVADDIRMESGKHYFDIDFSGIPSGRYFYRVETGDGGISVVPVVVER